MIEYKQTIKVLYVEDDGLFYDLIGLWLAGHEGPWHFELHRAESAREYEDTVESVNPDVILLDTHLTNSRGKETIRRIKAKTDRAIVVLSAYKYGEFGVDAKQAGADEFVSKSEANAGSVARAILYAMERHENLEKDNGIRRAAHGLRSAAGALRGDHAQTR